MLIKAKCKSTRTVNVKNNNKKVLSKSMINLSEFDRISKSSSFYIKDNQFNNIEYLASPSNKIQPSICNQRRVINNPLEVENNISTCRLNISNEQTSFKVLRDFDLQKEKRHYHLIKNIAPNRKKKDVSPDIGSYIMISNNNTIISLNLRKKLKNVMLLNSNINHTNANSHNIIIKNINTKPIVNKQQHVQQQIDQQQFLFTTTAKQISKKVNTSFPSHIV